MDIEGLKKMSRTMSRTEGIKAYKSIVEQRHIAEMAREKEVNLEKNEEKKHEVSKLRERITPGTVLILLSGRFKGGKVVYLKRLESGALLVTGPHKFSGIPLQRIDQTYVIATSIKLDIGDVIINEEINDDMFKKDREEYKEYLENARKNTERSPVSENRKALQKEVDDQIIPKVESVEYLKGYMGERFRLRDGDLFHKIKF